MVGRALSQLRAQGMELAADRSVGNLGLTPRL